MLQKQLRYTLGKEERLKSRKVIELLFKEGKSFSNFPFRVVWKYLPPENNLFLQAGFTVSNKYFKKATDRNRIRRLMKEGYRLQKNELQQQVERSNKKLAVFFIYVAKEIPAYALVFEKMTVIIRRLQKMANENTSANS
jgi:ribonuclease P protein component